MNTKLHNGNKLLFDNKDILILDSNKHHSSRINPYGYNPTRPIHNLHIQAS